MSEAVEIGQRSEELLAKVQALLARVDRFEEDGDARIQAIRERADEVQEQTSDIMEDLRQSHHDLAELLADNTKWVFDSEAALSEAGTGLRSDRESIESDGESAAEEALSFIGVVDVGGPAIAEEVGQRFGQMESDLTKLVDSTTQASSGVAEAFAEAMKIESEALHDTIKQVSRNLGESVQSLRSVMNTEASELKTAMTESFALTRDGSIQLVSGTEKAVRDTVNLLGASVTDTVRDLQSTCSMVVDTCTQLADLSRNATEATESTNQGMQVAAELVEQIKRVAEEIEDAFNS